MKLMIEISNETYEHIKENTEDSNDEYNAIVAIRHGTLIKTEKENKE